LRKAENDRSLVFLLKSKARTFLFTGDLPSKLEKKLPEAKADILKAGHHGSRYSSSLDFLKMLGPKMCVVSVGKINSYGHPNPEALARMKEAHCAILRTDVLGDITIEI
jgi:competence protein ComEC